MNGPETDDYEVPYEYRRIYPYDLTQDDIDTLRDWGVI